MKCSIGSSGWVIENGPAFRVYESPITNHQSSLTTQPLRGAGRELQRVDLAPHRLAERGIDHAVLCQRQLAGKLAADPQRLQMLEIGRAVCRERGCQYV